MPTATQFSVFLINKPGVLAKVVGAIAQARINVVALTIADAQEHGVLRVVGDNPEHLRGVLQQLNQPMLENEVISVELPNRPGALAAVLAALASEHVNIQYAYVTAGAPGGKTIGILKVDNLHKADKLLQDKRKIDTSRGVVKVRAGRRV